MIIILNIDVTLHMLGFLSGYFISQLCLSCKYYRDLINKNEIIWTTMLKPCALELTQNFPWGFVPKLTDCSPRIIYTSAYLLCKYSVRVCREELLDNYNIFRDSVIAFIEVWGTEQTEYINAQHEEIKSICEKLKTSWLNGVFQNPRGEF